LDFKTNISKFTRKLGQFLVVLFESILKNAEHKSVLSGSMIQLKGTLDSSQLKGTLDSSQLKGTLDSSQLKGTLDSSSLLDQ
jgi:hypothetical protein